MVGYRANGLSIGVLSARSGCKVETIRYYERIGILPKVPRTPSGHRAYTQDHLKRLTFIRRSRELGFSLEEVRDLIGLVDIGGFACRDVRAIANRHLENVRAKIGDLRRMEASLADLVEACAREEAPSCPIIEALSGADAADE